MFYVELVFGRTGMAVLGLAGEGTNTKSLTRREHRAPGGGLPYFFSQARTLGQPGERNCHMGQARWYDVYGLAVSENVPPSEDVSDRSCTTQFMFDPAAACMGHSGILDICKRGCNCFPPEVGTAPKRSPGVHLRSSGLASSSRSASLSFRVDSTRGGGLQVECESADGALAGNPAQIIFGLLTTIG